MICGTETNEAVKLQNFCGEWRCVTSPTTQAATYDGTTLRGGPYDGMRLADIPADTLVYVDTTGTDEANESNESNESAEVTAESSGSVSDTIDKAVSWAVAIANDNSHGYSQSVRWGPSYDCSSLVISAWEQAGIPVKTKGASYTGNMLQVFLSCGFRDVTHEVHISDGSGIVKGDVLLNVQSHTALAIGSGQVVHARSSEGTSDTADNSGQEIRCQSYWNYPWDYILRLS